MWFSSFPDYKNSKRYFQGDLPLTIIDFPVFTNIAMTTIFHIYRCEIFLPEGLSSVATMINWWGCHNC